MREVMDGRPLPYTSAMGLPALRRAIADFYRERHDVTVDPAHIAVTSGASCALLLAIAATTDPGDEVILADPSYPCNRQLVETFGGRVVAVPATAATRFQLATAAVVDAWSERTGAVMIASPSNPTGTSIPFDELTAICSLARERGAWRIVDEIYLDLSDPAPRRPAAAQRPDRRPGRDRDQQLLQVLRHDRLAARLGRAARGPGPGVRASWRCTTSCPRPRPPSTRRWPRSRPSRSPCARSAASSSPPAARSCSTGSSASACPSRRIPDGAFYVYFDVSGTGLSAWEFCRRALAETHVALTPGTDFGAHTADTHVRLSYAASRDELRDGLSRLGTFVATLGQPRS